MKLLILTLVFCLPLQSSSAEPRHRVFPGETKKEITIKGTNHQAAVYSPPVAMASLLTGELPIDPACPEDVLLASAKAIEKRDFETFRKLHVRLEAELKRVGLTEEEFKKEMIEAWEKIDAKEYLCARVKYGDSFLYVIAHQDPKTGAWGKYRSVIQIVKEEGKCFIKPRINSTDEVISFLVTNDIGQPRRETP